MFQDTTQILCGHNTGNKLYKTNVRDVGHCGYWDTWYIFNVQSDAKNVRNVQNLIFLGGNAMIDTIYSIYLTQWEQLSKSIFFVWPTRVFIDGTASSWEVLYETQFFTSLWNKKAWRLEPRRRGRVSWSEVWFSPCQLSFGRHHHHQHSSKPVSLHHQLHLHHRHHQQQHHRLKGCD